jgi:pimeloyl-ACP methyl ester carboxylesterase
MLKYEKIDNGKAEWVVFIHGIGGSTNTWKKQRDSFSEKYNLLLLDLPGHGENSKNIIYRVIPQKLNKGIKETMDHLGITSAHFVGLSLGTIVIANFAIYYPEYVKTIILGGSVLKLCGIYKCCVALSNKIKHYVPYKFLYKFFAWFMMPKKNHEKSRKIFLREVIKLDKTTMFAWIEYLQRSLHPNQMLSKLNQLDKRILLISGDEDHCFLKGAKILAEQMKNMEIKIIKHCGHVCSIEQWKLFNNHALNFLAV